MKKNFKKAFTLVELLVVIAILAILATVTIVGYTSLTKKARISNDQSVISQMNVALQANEINNKPETIGDALEQLEGAGFIVEKLTPTADGYEYIYNQVSNRFVYVDEAGKEVNGELAEDLWKNWVIASEYNATRGYSVYLKEGCPQAIINATTGVDVGKNTGITRINYTGTGIEKDVVIRTNGGDLVIDAATDTVYHYGESSLVKVVNVASHSYHEEGAAATLIAENGHIVISKGAKVGFYDPASTVTSEIVGSVEVSTVEVAGAKVVEKHTELDTTSAANGYYTLSEDVVLTAPWEIENTVVLDLNGHTITCTATGNTGGILRVKRGGFLTINDSSEGKTGTIDGGSAYAGVTVTVKGDDETKIAKLVVNGGSISGLYYGIAGNGSRHNTEIEINGGHIFETDVTGGTGIYHPQYGKLTITSGTIEGYDTALEIRAGVVVITGGTFTSKATSYQGKSNGNGTSTSGAAVAIAQHTTAKKIDVTIEGGEFTGPYAIAMNDVEGVGTSNVFVTVVADNCKLNGEVKNFADSNWTLR